MYTTSKHAQERSARKEAGLPLDQEPSRHSDGDWVVAAAKGVFSRIISSFGIGAPPQVRDRVSPPGPWVILPD